MTWAGKMGWLNSYWGAPVERNLPVEVDTLKAELAELRKLITSVKEACDAAAWVHAETAASQADALAMILQKLQNMRLADSRIIS
jgi:hypothetical protein